MAWKNNYTYLCHATVDDALVQRGLGPFRLFGEFQLILFAHD